MTDNVAYSVRHPETNTIPVRVDDDRESAVLGVDHLMVGLAAVAEEDRHPRRGRRSAVPAAEWSLF